MDERRMLCHSCDADLDIRPCREEGDRACPRAASPEEHCGRPDRVLHVHTGLALMGASTYIPSLSVIDLVPCTREHARGLPYQLAT